MFCQNDCLPSAANDDEKFNCTDSHTFDIPVLRFHWVTCPMVESYVRMNTLTHLIQRHQQIPDFSLHFPITFHSKVQYQVHRNRGLVDLCLSFSLSHSHPIPDLSSRCSHSHHTLQSPTLCNTEEFEFQEHQFQTSKLFSCGVLSLELNPSHLSARVFWLRKSYVYCMHG